MRLSSIQLGAGVLALGLLVACETTERPGLAVPGGATGGGSGFHLPDGTDTCEGPPEPDTASLCGNEVVSLSTEKPNLYFLLDSSGSMNETLPGSSRTKIAAAKSALREVTTELGHRIRYGLTHFPGPDPGLAYGGCAPGAEVFETQEGDPITCVNQTPGGPVLNEFKKVLSNLDASGGTALNAALTVISPQLRALEGKTAVLLLTDGAPNCNPNALCTADYCAPNIEGASINGVLCTPDFNCCEPGNADQTLLISPGANCVDLDNSLLGIAALADAGIVTYVIGVPGSEIYVDVMNQLAMAGGTARDGTTKYYDVGSESELIETLKNLGAEFAQSCDIELQQVPATPLVNVYLDATLIARSATDGWTLTAKTVSLHGPACDKVKAGEVNQVQVVTGCQTLIK